METYPFGFRLPANAPEGQKRFPISYTTLFIKNWNDYRKHIAGTHKISRVILVSTYYQSLDSRKSDRAFSQNLRP